MNCRVVTCWLLLLLLAVGGATGGVVWASDTTAAIDAWRTWKSIDAAIALEPLDGPEDIREKADIIADRLDELAREQARLAKEIEQGDQLVRSLQNQREILRSLVELQGARSAQSPQQLHELTGRIQQQEQLLKRRKDSMRDLQQEVDRLRRLLADYTEKANALQQREGNAP